MNEEEFLEFVEDRLYAIETEMVLQGWLHTNTKTALISMVDSLAQKVNEMDEF